MALRILGVNFLILETDGALESDMISITNGSKPLRLWWSISLMIYSLYVLRNQGLRCRGSMIELEE